MCIFTRRAAPPPKIRVPAGAAGSRSSRMASRSRQSRWRRRTPGARCGRSGPRSARSPEGMHPTLSIPDCNALTEECELVLFKIVYIAGSRRVFSPSGKNAWDLTGANTRALPVGVGTSQVPYSFIWAEIRYEFTQHPMSMGSTWSPPSGVCAVARSWATRERWSTKIMPQLPPAPEHVILVRK